MRRAARTDDNHAEILAAFRACGFYVHDTSALGKGFPDAVVYRPLACVRLIEIKDGKKPPSRRTLTKAEKDFAARFPVWIVESVEDVERYAREWTACLGGNHE